MWGKTRAAERAATAQATSQPAGLQKRPSGNGQSTRADCPYLPRSASRDLDAVQVRSDLDAPVEYRCRLGPPVVLLARRHRRDAVREDQGADTRPRCGSCGLLDRRMVIADVANPLLRQRLNQVF